MWYSLIVEMVTLPAFIPIQSVMTIPIWTEAVQRHRDKPLAVSGDAPLLSAYPASKRRSVKRRVGKSASLSG